MNDVDSVRSKLADGAVIPACPLALNSERKFDERDSVLSFATTWMPAQEDWPSVCIQLSSPFAIRSMHCFGLY